MSLYLVKRGKYRVKELNFSRKVRKRLKNRGFGVGRVVEKLNSPKFGRFDHFWTSEGIFSLRKRIMNSIIVEKVDK